MITAPKCEGCIIGICVGILIAIVLLILITIWWYYKGELFRYICTYIATHTYDSCVLIIIYVSHIICVCNMVLLDSRLCAINYCSSTTYK